MVSTLLPLYTFAFAMAFTPGPNIVMLTASGVNFGFQRSLPHIFGISIGMQLMIVVVGAGLGQVFVTFPQLRDILKWIGSIYLLFLAWKIATAVKSDSAENNSSPLTFLQALIFQWVNPKGWVAILAAFTSFTSATSSPISSILTVALAFFLTGIGATFVWAYFGVLIGKLFKSTKSLMIFNTIMAALIIASIALLYL